MHAEGAEYPSGHACLEHVLRIDAFLMAEAVLALGAGIAQGSPALWRLGINVSTILQPLAGNTRTQ